MAMERESEDGSCTVRLAEKRRRVSRVEEDNIERWKVMLEEALAERRALAKGELRLREKELGVQVARQEDERHTRMLEREERRTQLHLIKALLASWK